VRLGVDIGPKYNFYAGLDNLTNTKPPLGLTGIGGGSGEYDNRGRFFYAGVLAKF
jgi:outer membrane receptor protein involved in Fe transport